ncbi:hypothetical protein O181_063515 [Austropuccinia psidii MF-1]|uniref:Uncharacterized protein n=1 Tax=Austropuccinia psidii MF-1 TaxID=1389203 RepID=A0A9Q3EIY0_9BASI|nr:hypothetical protein [Austropuccinia psidii MF-1]
MLVMLVHKHTRNACLLSNPSSHAARGVPNQDALVRTPLWTMMMKAFPSGNGRRDPKQADGNNYRQLSLSPQVLICPPPLGHHPMVTSLLDWRKVIIRPMKDGNGRRTFELGPIVTMSCHPWDSNAKNKTHQIPHKKTLLLLICLASKLRGNPLQARVAPNGRRTYSANPPNTMSHLFQAQVKPQNHMRTLLLVSLNLRWLQCNPQRNLLVSPHLTFFTILNFSSLLLQPSPSRTATPTSVIIIDNTPVGSPPPLLPWRSLPLPQEHNHLPSIP